MTQNYASLQETPDFYGEYGTGEYAYTIPDQHMSEPKRSQWNHIEDLDSFFTRVYKYHQKHGFKCMAVQQLVAVNQFIFVSGIVFTVLYGINYDLLFTNDPTKNSRMWIFSVLKPVDEVMNNLPPFAWFLLLFLAVAFLFSVIKIIHSLIMYWDIKKFYNQALKIPDCELDNLTWHDVQKKVIQAQLELQMCIHKRELTELDIYHRILRQTNYLVALVNKKLLPPRIQVPLLGELVYWTKGLRVNILFLLFWSPWAPFENPWHLREEFKRPGYREKMSKQLGHQVLWLFLLNVLAFPLVFLGQIIFYFFNYFELVRKEPGKFGMRYWSHYGQLYFRHFNELDHELKSRLRRAYKPATRYMTSFGSPLCTILAEHVSFICSSILAVLIGLSFLDNEILYWDQVLSLLALLTGIIGLARSMIPDETLIWSPEPLLQEMVLHTHYLPGDWQGYAHTSTVRHKVQQLFQYRFAALLEELLSPILVPYFLIKYVYPRTLDLVDFFRHFTVSVMGVGDVCSFAQMDVRKHGNPDWHDEDETIGDVGGLPANDQYNQAEDGKVELSLMHFTTTNPDWTPPPEDMQFVESINLQRNKQDFQAALSMFPEDDYPDVNRTQSMFASLAQPIRVPSSDQTVGSNTFLGQKRIRQSLYNQMSEGPDLINSIANMRKSTMILHNRHAMRSTTRLVHSAEETTPLLFRK